MRNGSTTPGLSSYSIPLYPELKDLDSMISDNSQIPQPKISTFSYEFMAGDKAKYRLFVCFLGYESLKGESP